MAHPICGKCGSSGVYSDRDIDGQLIIGCMMCGNRLPGAGKGFYMSDKRPLNGLQSIVKDSAVLNVVSSAESLNEAEQIIIEMYSMFERVTRGIIK